MNLNNVEAVREMLAEQLEMVINGSQTPSVFKQLANGAGKMFASAKLQIEYAQHVGGEANIEFMKGKWLKKSIGSPHNH